MAAKEATRQDPAAAAPAPRRNGKLFILIGIIVVLLCVVAVGAYALLLNRHAGADEEDAPHEAQAQQWTPPDASKPPVFLPFEPFTVNLQPDGVEQFLQVVISVRVADTKTADLLKSYTPQIRHEILSLLSGKKAAEITTPDGREDLAEEMRDLMNGILGWKPHKPDARGDDGPVMSVFFTQFIVQ